MAAFGTGMMGTIYATDNIEFIKTVPDGTVKIITLDEDGSLNPNDPNVIVGTCLLPPMEALIAENDGDEEMYDMHYISYLNTPEIQMFISAIIGALYQGQALLLYAPQLNSTSYVKKLISLMWELYGIGIGIIAKQECIYDERCIPIWLNMMYMANIIDLVEFLYWYPSNVNINNVAMNKLISELKPVGKSYEDRINEVLKFGRMIKQKPTIKPAIYDTRPCDALLW